MHIDQKQTKISNQASKKNPNQQPSKQSKIVGFGLNTNKAIFYVPCWIILFQIQTSICTWVIQVHIARYDMY
jgi:hypothetical protein